MTVDTSDLWVCPSCGKRLVTTRMWHSCGPHTVEDFMARKSEVAWSYWNRLCEMVGECGPYSIVANKTRLVFMVRVRFAGMDAVSDRGMSFSFWLKQPIDDARFRKVVHYGGNNWYHHLRVTLLDELDAEVQRWLCMSYQVGCQRPSTLLA
ncbi:MAG TPA: DUF5655 domain-containing protein [Acidimicrobiia bacterium]